MHLGRILIVIAVIVAGSSPVFIRILQDFGLGAIPITSGRSFVVVIILGVIFRSKIFEAKKDFLSVILVGLTTTFGMIAFAYAIEHAPAGIVISIFFLGPIWVLLYERIFKKIHNKGVTLAGTLGLLGMILIAVKFNWQAEMEVKGILVSFLGSGIWACMTVFISKSTKQINPGVVVFWSSAVSVIVLSWSLFSVDWTVEILKWTLLFGVTNGVIYFFLLFSAAKRIASASEYSVWQYLEVAVVWLVGVVGYNEPVYVTSILGTCVIVSAGIIISLQKNK